MKRVQIEHLPTLTLGMYLEKRSYSLLIWNASSRVWHITNTDTWVRTITGQVNDTYSTLYLCLSSLFLEPFKRELLPDRSLAPAAEGWPTQRQPSSPFQTWPDIIRPSPRSPEECIHVELKEEKHKYIHTKLKLISKDFIWAHVELLTLRWMLKATVYYSSQEFWFEKEIPESWGVDGHIWPFDPFFPDGYDTVAVSKPCIPSNTTINFILLIV